LRSAHPSSRALVRAPLNTQLSTPNFIEWPTTTLIVIGAGPAGYVAAIKAAHSAGKSRASTGNAAAERATTGAASRRRRCSKTRSCITRWRIARAEFGFKIDGLSFDWPAIVKAFARGEREKARRAVAFLFKKNKIDDIRGEASMDKAGEVKVKLADGKTETHTAAKVLIATGCVSREMPGLPFSGTTVVGSKGSDAAREAAEVDRSSLARARSASSSPTSFNAFGVKVTMIEMLPNLLPVEDTEVSQALEKSFVKQGIAFFTNTKTTKTEASDKGVKITVADAKGAEKVIEAEACPCGYRHRARVAGGSLKFELVKGFLKVNDRYETKCARRVCLRVTSSGRRGSRTSRVSRRSRPSKECSSKVTSRRK
jgi:dihydrolipoamide dehydrogenase